jgi:hypothetical protein
LEPVRRPLRRVSEVGHDAGSMPRGTEMKKFMWKHRDAIMIGVFFLALATVSIFLPDIANHFLVPKGAR